MTLRVLAIVSRSFSSPRRPPPSPWRWSRERSAPRSSRLPGSRCRWTRALQSFWPHPGPAWMIGTARSMAETDCSAPRAQTFLICSITPPSDCLPFKERIWILLVPPGAVGKLHPLGELGDEVPVGEGIENPPAEVDEPTVAEGVYSSMTGTAVIPSLAAHTELPGWREK